MSIEADQTIVWDLTPLHALLHVKTEPPGVSVQVDGVPAGMTPLVGMQIRPGSHTVSTRDRCFRSDPVRIQARSGKATEIHLQLTREPAGIEVRTFDQAGDIIEAEVFVDGRRVGNAPGVFEVPACAQMLETRFEGLANTKTRVKLRPRQVVRIDVTLRVPSQLAAIEPGLYRLGSDPSEEGRSSNESPSKVRITRPFWIQPTEVTQTQWEKVMGSNPSGFRTCGPTCPVERVSWWDAVHYLNKMSANEGLPQCYQLHDCKGVVGGGCSGSESQCTGDLLCARVSFRGPECTGYRLPTEAEWEVAARAGVAGPRHGPPADVAWFKGNSSGRTHPTGALKANPFGLYDMFGNVSEWVHDQHQAKRPPALPDDHAGANGQGARTAKGGFYDGETDRLRPAYRYGVEPRFRGNGLGFRPARTLE